MHPRLFELGHLTVYTYGVLAAMGLFLGLTLNVMLARRQGVNEEKAWNLGLIVIVAGVAGAKLLLVINDWPYYSVHLREIFSLNIIQAGGVFSGGLFLGVLAGMAYIKWTGMPMLRTLDAFAPGTALGHSIGRLGCFAAGCCYGKPTDAAWGVTFTDPIAKALVGTPLNIRIHPTQLYEFLAEMAIFAVLMWLFRRKHSAGQIAGTYAFLYGIARFIIEFYRDDPERGSVFGGAITLTQLLAIILVLGGGALWIRRELDMGNNRAQTA